MKVSYELNFPIVHPVSGMTTWHTATVAVCGLDLFPHLIRRVISTVISLDPSGGVGTMLGLAERLRCLGDATMNPDNEYGEGLTASNTAPPATILWGNYTYLDGVDLVVAIRFDESKVYVGGDEFSFDLFNWAIDSGTDWKAEFIESLGFAYAAATKTGGCSYSD